MVAIVALGAWNAEAQTVLKFSHTDQQQGARHAAGTSLPRRWKNTLRAATRCRCIAAASWGTTRRTSSS